MHPCIAEELSLLDAVGMLPTAFSLKFMKDVSHLGKQQLHTREIV